VARLRLGSYEFQKKGVSRFDPRDPYRLAIALSWPQFFAALLAVYLSVNGVFATLFWLVSTARRSCGSSGRTFPSFHSTGRSCMCWTTGAPCTATMGASDRGGRAAVRDA
jgi:hypothetical protein